MTMTPPIQTDATPRRSSTRLFPVGLMVAVLSLLAAAPAATADDSPTLTIAPTAMAIGGLAQVSAAGLGGLETAFFGLDSGSGGEFVESSDNRYASPVVAGKAAATFTATAAGTYTIAVGDGETPLATATITVSTDVPTPGASVAASPASIQTGQPATITATGLGGLENAGFGLDGTPGGSFAGGSTSVTAPVSNGTATTTFTADRAGTYTISVGDGETSLATTTVTVTAAAPAPTVTTTTSPTVAPATSPPTPASGGGGDLSLWILLIGAIVAVGAVVTTVIVRRRARGADAQAASPIE